MAGLKLTTSGTFKSLFDDLPKLFPSFRARMLGYVGNEGKKLLKDRLLSGQELNVRGSNAYAVDRKGKRLVSHIVGRGGAIVRIKAYPVNLFERATYGRGKVIGPGRFILTRKLRSLINNNLQKIADDFDNKILQKEVDKF